MNTTPAPIPAIDAASISTRAMLARLKISQWGSLRLDKVVTDEVARDKSASADAGKYKKSLLSKDALAAIQEAISAARTYHQEHTLPWFDDAYRALPAAEFMAYSEAMRGFKAEFQAAVQQLANDLPAHIERDKVRLGAMFKATDYPTPGELIDTYGFGNEFMPIPAGKDFRVDMTPEQRAQVQADIEARTMAALQIAQTDLWQRAHAAVSRMAQRLRAYTVDPDSGKASHPFRDSLVGNLRDLAALLPSLNVAGDPALADMARRLDEELCGYEAQDLRDSDVARDSVAQSAEDILAAMAGYIGTPAAKIAA